MEPKIKYVKYFFDVNHYLSSPTRTSDPPQLPSPARLRHLPWGV